MHHFSSWNRVVTKCFIHLHEFFLISRGAQCSGDGLSIVSPSNRRKVTTARRRRAAAAARMSVCMCSGLSTGHEKHDGRFAQKACVTSDDIFMWCHKLSLPIQKRSIFYHLGIQSCLSAFGGSLNSTPADWIVATAAATTTAAAVVTVEPIKESARITFYYLHNPLEILVHDKK